MVTSQSPPGSWKTRGDSDVDERPTSSLVVHLTIGFRDVANVASALACCTWDISEGLDDTSCMSIEPMCREPLLARIDVSV